jgi:hypothetical protein
MLAAGWLWATDSIFIQFRSALLPLCVQVIQAGGRALRLSFNGFGSRVQVKWGETAALRAVDSSGFGQEAG